MSDVVIIGAGHVGLTLLADLELTKSHHGLAARLLHFGDAAETRAHRRNWTQLVMENLVTGAVDTCSLHETQFASLWSEEGFRALQDAHTIIVTIPDIPHLRLALLDHLENAVSPAEKLIVFVRGGQGGQPVLAKWVRDSPSLRDASVILVEDSFYGTRVIDSVIQYKRKISVNVSVYSLDPDAALTALRRMFPLGKEIGRPSWPDLQICDGIDLLFNPLGYIIHLGVALDPANLDRTLRGVTYTHYVEGISPELATKLELLDRERVLLAQTFGAHAQEFPDVLQRQYGLPAQNSFYDMMQSCREIYQSRSSGSIDALRASRVLLEDVPAFHTIRWLASTADVSMPHTQAYFDEVLARLRDIGAESPLYTQYCSHLDEIDGGIEGVRNLLNQPHIASTVPCTA